MAESKKNGCESCKKLAAKVAELEGEFSSIQDQLAKANKNSATSSKPPSSDITNPPPKRKKPGRPRKRKRGGQPGHKRHERKSFLDNQVDLILEHRWEACPCCGGTLQDSGESPKTHRQVELADQPFTVAEDHCASRGVCQRDEFSSLIGEDSRRNHLGRNLRAT